MNLLLLSRKLYIVFITPNQLYYLIKKMEKYVWNGYLYLH